MRILVARQRWFSKTLNPVSRCERVNDLKSGVHFTCETLQQFITFFRSIRDTNLVRFLLFSRTIISKRLSLPALCRRFARWKRRRSPSTTTIVPKAINNMVFNRSLLQWNKLVEGDPSFIELRSILLRLLPCNHAREIKCFAVFRHKKSRSDRVDEKGPHSRVSQGGPADTSPGKMEILFLWSFSVRKLLCWQRVWNSHEKFNRWLGLRIRFNSVCSGYWIEFMNCAIYFAGREVANKMNGTRHCYAWWKAFDQNRECAIAERITLYTY